jgi:hypothetical protein
MSIVRLQLPYLPTSVRVAVVPNDRDLVYDIDEKKIYIGDGVTLGGVAMNSDGSPGSNGVGVPTGGSVGQILRKVNGTDYNTEWHSESDADLTFTDITTNNASTAQHGFAPKAVAPASNILNVIGIANGETVYTNKSLFDSTDPSAEAFGSAASAGTSMIAARSDHRHAMPDGPSEMTATTGGLVPTPPNNTTEFLRGDGTFAVPAAGLTQQQIMALNSMRI